MPSTKRRRTSQVSSASSRGSGERSGPNSPRAHKSARKACYNNNKENNDPDTTKVRASSCVESPGITPHGCSGSQPGKLVKKAPYDYICFHRPLYDVDGENWRKWSEGKEERLEKPDIFTKLYNPGYIAEDKRKIWAASPTQHEDHKWVIMWSAWLMFDGFCRRAKYCDPDTLNMYIYAEWKDWSMQEIIDNVMTDFDEAFKQKGAHRLEKMWAILSAIGLWVNVEDVAGLLSSGDREKDCELIGLLGCALLTVLSAIDRSGELKPDSRFLDLALVIGNFLELSHDLPAFGIEGACVCWRKEAVLFFKKGKLDHNRGPFDTEHRLKQLEHIQSIESLNSDDETDDESEAKLLHHKYDTETDPWAWGATMKKYRKNYGHTIGLQQYDFLKIKKARKE